MTEQTLKMKIEKLLISVGQRYDNAQHPALLIHTHTDEIIALILSEIDKAGLTDEALHKIHNCDDVCESECNLCSGCTLIKQVAGFQLEAIKKQLRG